MDQTIGADPLARARELAPEIDSSVDEIERLGAIPEPLLTQLHSARLFRMLLPRSVGGDQVTPGMYYSAVEEVARHDGSVAWNLFVGNSSALIAAYVELETARTIFSDPHTLVAWGAINGQGARAAPGGYRVSGHWDFASGCRHANWMGAHGPVTEPDGSLRLNRFGRPTIRTWLFPAVQARILYNWNTIGLRGTGSDSYDVSDVFVPEAFSTTREDPTIRRERGPLYAFTQSSLYAVGVAAVAMGLARAMLDHFIALASRKTPRGLLRIADDPLVQADVARLEAQLGAARAYLLDTLATIYAGADDIAPIEVPERARARLVCSHAIASAVGVADRVYKAAGVDGIFPGTPFERRFRDIHTVSQQIQSRDSHFQQVGQVLLGVPPEVFA